MLSRLARLAALAAAALVPVWCHAQQVHYAFSGDVYQAGSTDPAFDLGIAVDTSFTGEFWYDASTLAYSAGTTPDGGTQSAYRTGGLVVSVGGLTAASTTPAQIFVNDNAYAGYDGFSVSALAPIAVTGTTYAADAFFLGLNDATGTAWSSSALPTSFSSLFNDNGLGLQFVDDQGHAYSIYGNVTEFHAVAPVPEPAGYGLMLAGLAGLGIASRRLRRLRHHEAPTS